MGMIANIIFAVKVQAQMGNYANQWVFGKSQWVNTGVTYVPLPSITHGTDVPGQQYQFAPTFSLLPGSTPSAGCPSILPIAPLVQNLMDTIATNKLGLGIIENYIYQNNLYRKLRKDTTGMGSSTILPSFIATNHTTGKGKYCAIEDSMAIGNIAWANAQNTAYTPSNSVENNYKQFYALYAKHKTDITHWNSTDSIALFNLANSCPMNEGAVVYQARALYNSVYQTYRIFDEHCGQSNLRFTTLENNPELSLEQRTIYPNPSTGIWYISGAGSELNIEVLDMSGKSIYQGNYNPQGMDLHLSQGTYIVKCINPKTYETSIKKLVVFTP